VHAAIERRCHGAHFARRGFSAALAAIAKKTRRDVPDAIERFDAGEGALYVKGPFAIPKEACAELRGDRVPDDLVNGLDAARPRRRRALERLREDGGGGERRPCRHLLGRDGR